MIQAPSIVALPPSSPSSYRGSFRTCIHGHQPGIPVCHIGSFISHIPHRVVYRVYRVSCIVLLTWPISHQTLMPSFISHYLVPNDCDRDLETQAQAETRGLRIGAGVDTSMGFLILIIP